MGGENDFESERKTKKLKAKAKAKARDVKAALLAIKEDLEAASRLTDRLKSDDESNDGNRREGKRPRIRQKVVVSEATPLSSSSLSSLSPDSTTNPESVRQRIDRVRSGEMTDVERKAFLEAALRGQGLTFNAVDGDGRNENVGEDNEEIRNGSGGKRRRPEDVPSPFPTDPSYATAVGGYSEAENKESSLDDRKVGVKAESRQSRSSSTGRKKMSEKERLKYLEMVTDPKRFNSYITMGGGGGGDGGDNGSSNTNTNTNTND